MKYILTVLAVAFTFSACSSTKCCDTSHSHKTAKADSCCATKTDACCKKK